MVLLIVLLLVATAFWVWMLVDCAKRKFKAENEQLLWILLIVFTGLLGSLIYFFMIKNKNKKKRRNNKT